MKRITRYGNRQVREHPDRRQLQDHTADHLQPSEADRVQQCRGSDRWRRSAVQATLWQFRSGDQRMEDVANDRVAVAEGSPG